MKIVLISWCLGVLVVNILTLWPVHHGFPAESVKELRAAFEEAVNDYLATCEKSGRAPQKPYSGKLMLRVPPDVHARSAMMAEAHGMSLNQWAAEVLSRAF